MHFEGHSAKWETLGQDFECWWILETYLLCYLLKWSCRKSNHCQVLQVNDNLIHNNNILLLVFIYLLSYKTQFVKWYMNGSIETCCLCNLESFKVFTCIWQLQKTVEKKFDTKIFVFYKSSSLFMNS